MQQNILYYIAWRDTWYCNFTCLVIFKSFFTLYVLLSNSFLPKGKTSNKQLFLFFSHHHPSPPNRSCHVGTLSGSGRQRARESVLLFLAPWPPSLPQCFGAKGTSVQLAAASCSGTKTQQNQLISRWSAEVHTHTHILHTRIHMQLHVHPTHKQRITHNL